MKTDSQNSSTIQLPFYQKKIFWAVVLFLIFLSNILYTIFYTIPTFDFDVETILLSNIMVPFMWFSGLVSSGNTGLFITLILYTTLLYFSFFRKQVNFLTLTILAALMVWSTYILSVLPGFFN